MAEFTEIWENWRRMCHYQKDLGEGDCLDCPLRELSRGRDSMRKLSEIISDLNRVMEIINLYDDISKKTCGNCEWKPQECAYLPKWGEPVRYNCPFWAKAKEV